MQWTYNGENLEINWNPRGRETLIGRINGMKVWSPTHDVDRKEAKRSLERMTENIDRDVEETTPL